jgi:phytanoyl-CoA hydroxylase
MGGSSTDVMLDQLRQDGFALLEQGIDVERLTRLRADTSALISRFTDGGYRSADFWNYESETGGPPVLYRVHKLDEQGVASVDELLAGGPLHDLAAHLLGDLRPTVCAMVIKLPGVFGLPWHRDRDGVEPTTVINLSVFLDESTVDNGCFEAVPGSHLLGEGIDVEAVRSAGPRVAIPARAGDVLIHDVLLVHGSGDNTTTGVRRSIITEFAPPDWSSGS